MNTEEIYEKLQKHLDHRLKPGMWGNHGTSEVVIELYCETCITPLFELEKKTKEEQHGNY